MAAARGAAADISLGCSGGTAGSGSLAFCCGCAAGGGGFAAAGAAAAAPACAAAEGALASPSTAGCAAAWLLGSAGRWAAAVSACVALGLCAACLGLRTGPKDCKCCAPKAAVAAACAGVAGAGAGAEGAAAACTSSGAPACRGTRREAQDPPAVGWPAGSVRTANPAGCPAGCCPPAGCCCRCCSPGRCTTWRRSCGPALVRSSWLRMLCGAGTRGPACRVLRWLPSSARRGPSSPRPRPQPLPPCSYPAPSQTIKVQVSVPNYLESSEINQYRQHHQRGLRSNNGDFTTRVPTWPVSTTVPWAVVPRLASILLAALLQ